MWGYDVWEWGNAADWVGALGTTGAFFFGFYLLRREANEKRAVHADALLTEATYVHHPFTKQHSVVLDVENTGKYPVSGVALYQYAQGGPDMIAIFGAHENFRWKFKPRHTQRRTVDVEKDPRELKLFVEFTDVNGTNWYRRLDDGRYFSRREFNRIYWGTWFGEPDKAKIRKKAKKEAIQPPKTDASGAALFPGVVSAPPAVDQKAPVSTDSDHSHETRVTEESSPATKKSQKKKKKKTTKTRAAPQGKHKESD